MRMQPSPSLETIGPFWPKAIFFIVVIALILLINNTKICVVHLRQFLSRLNLIICIAHNKSLFHEPQDSLQMTVGATIAY